MTEQEQILSIGEVDDLESLVYEINERFRIIQRKFTLYNKGDLLYASAINVLGALGIGTANYKLFVNAAGDLPEWAAGLKIITATRAMDAASGDVGYTGVGFKPSLIIFLARYDNSISIGVDDLTTSFNVNNYLNTTYAYSAARCMEFIHSGVRHSTMFVKTMDADGFTGTWTLVGAGVGATGYFAAICFR